MYPREIARAIGAAAFGVVLIFVNGLNVGQMIANNSMGISPDVIAVIATVIGTLGGLFYIAYAVRSLVIGARDAAAL